MEKFETFDPLSFRVPRTATLLLDCPYRFLFVDMVNDAVIPMAAVGIKYFGGPLVTILASKTSRMYNSDIH